MVLMAGHAAAAAAGFRGEWDLLAFFLRLLPAEAALLTTTVTPDMLIGSHAVGLTS